MRFNYYLCTLLCLAGFMSLTSCDQEATPEYVPTIYEGAEYLANHETPTIIFQYDIKQIHGHKSSGWVIDNQGNLRVYQEVSAKIDGTTRKETLEMFLNKTEIVEQVDIETLVSMYKMKAQNRVSTEMIEEDLDDEAETSSTYYAYTLSYNSSPTNCNTTRAGGYYSRHILESIGDKYIEDQSITGRKILNWIKEFTAVLN